MTPLRFARPRRCRWPALLALSLSAATSFAAAPVATGHPSPAAEPAGFRPVILFNPQAISGSEILAGTAGTLSGLRLMPRNDKMEGALADWWNGPHMLGGDGNRFGPDRRGWFKDKGLVLDATYQGAFFGVVASEVGSRGFWDGQLNFTGQLNLGDLLDEKRLTGVQFFIGARYRDGWDESNPNNFVLAQGMFNPSNWQSGTQFRMLNFGVLLDSRKMLPIENLIVLKGGWVQPQREFADQPLSKLFLNNAVNSAKGIGGNIPFSSSASTWGGTLTLRPTKQVYLRNGLFLAYPGMTSSPNHGLMFEGNTDPSKNGLWYMGEVGVTPSLGSDRLQGKLALGGYYYGTPAGQDKWGGGKTTGQYGFYAQADQMFYREPSPGEASQLSPQGLSAFNLFFFTPGDAKSDVYPFYYQGGLAYTGLIPRRDLDITMISLGYGYYSDESGAPERSYTAVIEGGYRWQINGWLYAQPFFQYFSRPDGTDKVANAGILGVMVGAVF